MEFKHQIFSHVEEQSTFIGQFLVQLTQNQEKVYVAVSGGSTPKTLFANLSDHFSQLIKWDRIYLFWVDERCVPPDDEQSNYGMTKKYLLSNVTIPNSHVFRIQAELPRYEAVSRYQEAIENHLPIVKRMPQFDLIILGVGDDGHTASIFPHQMRLWLSDQSCDIATHPVSGQKRITLTGSLINRAKTIIVMVNGISKARIVKKIFNYDDEALKYPAALIDPHKSLWLLDNDSASLLEK